MTGKTIGLISEGVQLLLFYRALSWQEQVAPDPKEDIKENITDWLTTFSA